MKILVVEDEKRMAQALRRGLEEESYSVTMTADGFSAVELAGSDHFDLILLDLMLPGIDGFEVTKRLRGTTQSVAILMLTARDTVPDMVRGLDCGADDYITKPFPFEVLLARIRAIERRRLESHPRSLRVADLVLEKETRRVFRGKREINLTQTEFRLLEYLMLRKGRVATREAIIREIWQGGETVEENTLDAFVRLLRQKINLGEDVKLIETRRGFGYCIEENSPQ
ncbi:MAG: response regulator transcription factor [Candidatus Acidiferrales bacterium]|jgi:DNA-binding response OmpR family regulator